MTDHTPDYWLGYLASALAHAAPDLPKHEKQTALKQLDAFLKSDAATTALRDAIKAGRP